jgi:hypothetical protein
MMEQSPQAQIEIYLSHLGGLILRGRELRKALVTSPSNESVMVATRAWQEDCGATVNQLSGGSKAHWLARAFSQAFLMRSTSGRAAETASPDEIVTRLLDVLGQAVASLSRKDVPGVAGDSSASEAPEPRRFEFVHDAELRRVVEQAFTDSRNALEQGRYEEALRTSCGILEAIVTDALEHHALEHSNLENQKLSGLAIAAAAFGKFAPEKIVPEKIADWSFETRLAVAEKLGLIRGGCARLPATARTYRDHSKSEAHAPISERDARQTGQVLRVVMRDLDPGR